MLETFDINPVRNELEELKTKIEKIGVSSALDRISQIRGLIVEASKPSDFAVKSQIFNQINKTVNNLIDEYEQDLNSRFVEDLKSFCNLINAYENYFQGIAMLRMISSKNIKEFTENIREHTIGTRSIAKAFALRDWKPPIDEYSHFNVIADSTLKLESQVNPEYWKGNESDLSFYRQILRDSASFILQKIKQLEKDADFSTVGSILEYVKASPEWQGDDFEECLEDINNLRS